MLPSGVVAGSSHTRVTFGGSQPILHVSDLQASVDYYVKALGFKVDFVESIASVSRGRCAFFLVQGDQGHPGSWACEMQVEDLDGNVLRFGSEPKPHERFGPWRDMRGDLWVHTAEGQWIREDRS